MTATQNVRAAAIRLALAVAARDKVAGAIDALASPLQQPSAQEIDVLRTAYENAAADVALGLATDAQSGAARAALEQAKSKQLANEQVARQATAVRAGLERRLADADAAILLAERQLAIAEGEYLASELELADTEYLQGARQADASLRRIEVLRSALGVRGLLVPPGMRYYDLKLSAAGPVSAAAAMKTNPNAPHGFGVSMFLYQTPEAAEHDRKSLSSELADIAQAQGIIARVRSAISNAAA